MYLTNCANSSPRAGKTLQPIASETSPTDFAELLPVVRSCRQDNLLQVTLDPLPAACRRPRPSFSHPILHHTPAATLTKSARSLPSLCSLCGLAR
jgi:hypothetical protein